MSNKAAIVPMRASLMITPQAKRARQPSAPSGMTGKPRGDERGLATERRR